MRTNALTAADGLSSDVVTAVYRDRTGFLWVGTQDGLNRYDGYEVRAYRYDRSDPNSLVNHRIRSIHEDPEGRFWIGTGGAGLSLMDRRRGTFERVRLGRGPAEGDQFVESIVDDGSGGLWLGTLGQGLIRYDPGSGTVQTFDADASLPGALTHSMVNVVYRDRGGGVWVGTDGGLNLLLPGSATFRAWRGSAGELSHDRVLSVVEDSTGVLWVGTEEGLNRFDPADSSFHQVAVGGRPGGISHPHITSLAAGPPGTLWLGTFGGGLDELDVTAGRVRAVHRAEDGPGLVEDRIRRIFAEDVGTLWLGTWGGGVTRVAPLPLVFTWVADDSDSPGNLPSATVNDMAVDRSGRLWVASSFSGLSRLESSGAFSQVLHDPDDPTTVAGDDPVALLAASDGHLWVGTWQNGLNRLDPETGAALRYRADSGREGSLTADRITALAEDGSGRVWVGTGSGVSRLEDVAPPGRFAVVPGLEGVYVEHVLATPDGVVWVGTAGTGLVRIDRDLTVRRFRADAGNPNSLGHDDVTTLFRDGGGRLWIGTRGGGLDVLAADPGRSGEARFVHYDESSGLVDDAVAAITPDRLGRLWISTQGGLSIMDPAAGTILNFDRGNGLPSEEFTGAALIGPEGDILLGTASGVLAAPADVDLPPPASAPVVVMRARALEADESLIAPSETPAVVHYGDVAVFEFAVLNLDGASESEYAYRLDGLGDDWVQLDTSREIAFTGLSPGDYTLRVRGRARNGTWAEAPPVPFQVAAPLWRTPWFRGLLALLVVAAILLAYNAWVGAERSRRRAVREKEAQFTALMENSHDMVVLLDEDFRVLYQGPSIRRILGYEPEAGVGASPLDIVHREESEAGRRWLEELLVRPDRTRRTRVRVRTAQGGWITAEVLGTAFDTPDGRRNLILNARDVTPWVEAEARTRELESVLQQRQRLDAIGTLAGGVAHDFNNLLTVIGGHAQLLEDDAGDRDATLESAHAIRQAQESGAALTRQLLAFARKQVVTPRVLDVNRHVSELQKMLRRLVGAHVALELELGAGESSVEADAGQLEQVLMNLVVNARDAMPDGGRIRIRTSNEQIAGSPDAVEVPGGDWVVIHVADTGVGIPESALPHIFEPFFTTKGMGQGTGLGLSTVYGIVTQSGGRVTVDSRLGSGSEFHIYLPVAERQPDARSRTEVVGTEDPSGALETVLVVEDDPEIRSLVRRILARQGYRVEVAVDGLDALTLLHSRASSPDLMITDLIMPNVTGAELVTRARASFPDLPVVLMSGYADASIARQGLDPDADILLKPFTPHELLARVTGALAGVQGSPGPISRA